MLTADEIIRLLDLKPHPEGGHYRETFRDAATVARRRSGRAASTAIYFLLRAGEVSRWHRVDAAEVWHWYAGAPLALTMADGGGPARASGWSRPRRRRAPAGGGAGRRLAAGREPRRLDARRLHGGARLRVRGLRAGAAGLRAGLSIPVIAFALPLRPEHGAKPLIALEFMLMSAEQPLRTLAAAARTHKEVPRRKCDNSGAVENEAGKRAGRASARCSLITTTSTCR